MYLPPYHSQPFPSKIAPVFFICLYFWVFWIWPLILYKNVRIWSFSKMILPSIIISYQFDFSFDFSVVPFWHWWFGLFANRSCYSSFLFTFWDSSLTFTYFQALISNSFTIPFHFLFWFFTINFYQFSGHFVFVEFGPGVFVYVSTHQLSIICKTAIVCARPRRLHINGKSDWQWQPWTEKTIFPIHITTNPNSK